MGNLGGKGTILPDEKSRLPDLMTKINAMLIFMLKF